MKTPNEMIQQFYYDKKEKGIIYFTNQETQDYIVFVNDERNHNSFYTHVGIEGNKVFEKERFKKLTQLKGVSHLFIASEYYEKSSILENGRHTIIRFKIYNLQTGVYLPGIYDFVDIENGKITVGVNIERKGFETIDTLCMQIDENGLPLTPVKSLNNKSYQSLKPINKCEEEYINQLKQTYLEKGIVPSLKKDPTKEYILSYYKSQR